MPAFPRFRLAAVSALALAATVATAAPPTDPAAARRAFGEAAEICRRDGGALWGVSLCGPILLVDPASRRAVADRADGNGVLRARDGVWEGVLPDAVPAANTAVDWGGVRWTELLLPLPEGAADRRRLLAHELFHRVQQSLGIALANPANAHLDTAEGRLWMRLEWKALARALGDSGRARRRALEDALLFRHQRRALFPAAAPEENALEASEGLAEYTGVVLGDGSGARAAALANLAAAPSRPTFVRSFAYASGPAYGLLLDGALPAWRKRVGAGTDLGELAAEAYGLELPQEAGKTAEARARHYGGEAIRKEEVAREETRLERQAVLRAHYLLGPVLVLPVHHVQISFDPRNLEPLGNDGTFYPGLRASDAWGVLEASGGAFVSADGTRIQVPGPVRREGSKVEGPGWSLSLADGWRLGPGPRGEDATVVQAAAGTP